MMVSVILSGGSGTRLWPVSRAKLPKQFCDLFTETLFSQTCKRLQKLGSVQVCTSKEMKTLTEKSIRQDSLVVEQCLYEPFGRNTAPAVALVCQNLKLQGKQSEVVGIFPSDHWVEKTEVFSEVMDLAKDCAQKKQIVTIGIQPSHPATGFGYIETKEQSFGKKGPWEALEVEGFHEKPDMETAQGYLNKGCYHWNSGMFVFSCETMIEAFEKYMPEMWDNISTLKSDLSNLEEVYNSLESQSLDYGIMEKAQNQVCIPCDLGWSDMGSWDDVATIEKQEKIKNEAIVVEKDSKNCFAYSSLPKTIALAGVENLLVVDTEDALVITRKGSSQDIKKLNEEVKKVQPHQATDHVYEYRPWGVYRNLWEESDFKTKVITVDPGQQLSYQSHTKRTEIWIVVQGQGEVVLDDQVIPVEKGITVKITQGSKHRMRNNGVESLKFVEVQLGTYFGEDDITRYQDAYQRT